MDGGSFPQETTTIPRDIPVKNHIWAVWKRCRLAGYVEAYGQWDALKKAEEKFGKEIFLVRNESKEPMEQGKT